MAKAKAAEAAPRGIDPQAPPWVGDAKEITESQLEQLRLRASREDYRKVIAALQEYGGITVTPDP